MQYKFGLSGTSCSGKTTLAYGLVSRLKSYGLLADGVFNQDRKFSFDRHLLETDEQCQNWMITNLIAKEIELSRHGDVNTLISDRTVLDFFAYYKYQYDTELSRALYQYVKQWCTTYTRIYILEPLPYQYDGKRPADDFRLGVDKVLSDIASDIPNVVKIERASILNDILLQLGFTKPNVKNTITTDDIAVIAKTLNKSVVFKPQSLSTSDTVSDVDLHIVYPELSIKSIKEIAELENTCKSFIKGILGPFVPLDIHLCKIIDSFDSKFMVMTQDGVLLEIKTQVTR